MTSNREQDAGLIIIQIDGLSRRVLKQALEEGRMPFLAGLSAEEDYKLFPLYPGVPSTTPRVQGQLFYGVEMIVPAFSFRDHLSGRIMRLYDPEAAALIEDKLRRQGEGLLRNGSSYANVYCGDSEECHFCTVSFGKDRLFREQNLVKLPVVFYKFFKSLFKSSLLIFVEMVLAFFDFLRGIMSGHSLYKELKFIPSRIAISILLRDLVRDSVIVDIKENRPIIHLNLMGYDEHAHRRGPYSLFALKTLSGIDYAISKIWSAARKNGGRNYSIWVYSDHGQEDASPYELEQGRTLREAVESVLSEYEKEKLSGNTNSERRGIQSMRSSLLGGRIGRIIGLSLFNNDYKKKMPVVTAVGPLGHIYLTAEPGMEEKRLLGGMLVAKAAIPLVLTSDGNGKVIAWNRDGEFVLPDQPAEVLGADHPYQQEVVADLVKLCHQEDAGTYVISGWRPQGKPLSFPIERGAHGGPGYGETDAFALLPKKDFTDQSELGYIGVSQIRLAALAFRNQNREK